MIVKKGGKYELESKKTHKNLGTYSSRAGAVNRERQVEYFKHLEASSDLPPGMGLAENNDDQWEEPPEQPYVQHLGEGVYQVHTKGMLARAFEYGDNKSGEQKHLVELLKSYGVPEAAAYQYFDIPDLTSEESREHFVKALEHFKAWREAVRAGKPPPPMPMPKLHWPNRPEIPVTPLRKNRAQGMSSLPPGMNGLDATQQTSLELAGSEDVEQPLWEKPFGEWSTLYEKEVPLGDKDFVRFGMHPAGTFGHSPTPAEKEVEHQHGLKEAQEFLFARADPKAGEYSTTMAIKGQGRQATVLSHALKAASEFLTQHRPVLIKFSGYAPSRAKAYQHVLMRGFQKLAAQHPDYVPAADVDPYSGTFYIVHKSLAAKEPKYQALLMRQPRTARRTIMNSNLPVGMSRGEDYYDNPGDSEDRLDEFERLLKGGKYEIGPESPIETMFTEGDHVMFITDPSLHGLVEEIEDTRHHVGGGHIKYRVNTDVNGNMWGHEHELRPFYGEGGGGNRGRVQPTPSGPSKQLHPKPQSSDPISHVLGASNFPIGMSAFSKPSWSDRHQGKVMDGHVVEPFDGVACSGDSHEEYARRVIESARPEMAKAAQDELDNWEQDEEGLDPNYGCGGSCDQVSQAIGDVLANKGFAITDGGQEGDDHAYVIAHTGDHAFAVDIHPSVYESGGGYSWRKRHGVQILPRHIDVDPIDIDYIPQEERAEAREDWKANHGEGFSNLPPGMKRPAPAIDAREPIKLAELPPGMVAGDTRGAAY